MPRKFHYDSIEDPFFLGSLNEENREQWREIDAIKSQKFFFAGPSRPKDIDIVGGEGRRDALIVHRIAELPAATTVVQVIVPIGTSGAALDGAPKFKTVDHIEGIQLVNVVGPTFANIKDCTFIVESLSPDNVVISIIRDETPSITDWEVTLMFRVSGVV